MDKIFMSINKNKYRLMFAIIVVMIISSLVGVYKHIYNQNMWNMEYKKELTIKDFTPNKYILTGVSNDSLQSFGVNNGNCFGISFLEKYNYLKINKNTDECDKIIDKLDSRKLLNYDNLYEDLSSYNFRKIAELNLINIVDKKIKNSEGQSELSYEKRLDILNQTLEESTLDDSYISMLRDIYYIQEEYRNNPQDFLKYLYLSKDVNIDYLVSNISNNIPVVTGVVAKNSGHALLAYGYSLNGNILSIHCIDPNNPEIITEIKLEYKFLKWKYIDNYDYKKENGVAVYSLPDIEDHVKTVIFS